MSNRTAAVFIAVVLLSISISGLSGCGGQEKIDYGYELMSMQEQGQIDSMIMAGALASSDNKNRIMAARTCGIVRDMRFTGPLLEFANDDNVNLRLTAIFALGETGDTSVVNELLKLAGYQDTITALAAIEAIGKIGENVNFPSGADSDGRVIAEKALAIWRMNRLESLGDLKKWVDMNGLARYAAVYAMFRMAPDSCADDFLDVYASGSGDDDFMLDETRGIAARGLAAAGDSAGLLDIFDKHYNDQGKSGKIEIIRGMGNLKIGSDRLEKLLLITEDNGILREIILSIGGIGDKSSLKTIEEYLEHQSLQVRLAAISALPKISEQSSPSILSRYLADHQWQIRAEVAGAFGEVGSRTAEKRLRQMLTDNDDRVRAAVIQALGKFPVRRNLDLIRAALFGSNDPVVRSVAADVLGSTGESKALELLTEASGKIDSSENIDYCRSLVAALGNYVDTTESGHRAIAAIMPFMNHHNRIVRQDAAAALKEFAPADFDSGKFDIVLDRKNFDFMMGLRNEKPAARISTSRGDIIVELDPWNAPRTVANFIRLANRKFYDGLTFHRVVQDFVVQGGCPRGDGWGGPEYTIREEINPRRFEKGTIGMATSGRDTGGSQFFICLSSQPHLDGRYTAFGQVAEGLATLYNVEMGDTINSVTLEKER